MFVIKNRKLQGVNHSADGVEDTAAKQKGESAEGYITKKLREGQQTTPTHGDVNNCGYPFRTVDKKQALENADDGNAPNKGNQPYAGGAGQSQQANRSVGAGNQNINHQVVQFLEAKIAFYGATEGMV